MLKRLFLLPVHAYRFFLSPWMGWHCRFQPTCSAYMIEAVQKHGVVKGFYLGVRRILACHPWSHRPPLDPVP